METISIINLKGGTGKTVTAVNMAAELAGTHGQQVLVIDADPQANATAFFGINPEGCCTVADILRDEVSYIYDCVYKTNLKNVDCVPAAIDLIEADISTIRTGVGVNALALYLEEFESDHEIMCEEGEGVPYDTVIIDCPPCFTAASVAAIAASDKVIIPVKLDAFGLAGMREMLAQVDGLRSIRSSVTVAGVLITLWHRAPAITQGEELLRKSGLRVFDTHIRRSDKVDESTFARQPLREYSPTSAAGRDYKRFVAEFLGKEAEVK